MKVEFKSVKCDHQKSFNSDDELICMQLLSNCKICFMKQYLSLVHHKNIQIAFIKLIGKPFWLRNKKTNRLVRLRNAFWGNQKCRGFGLECNHEKRFAYQTPSNFISFPKYNGESDRMYKSRLSKKYATMIKHKGKVESMIRDKKCSACGVQMTSAKCQYMSCLKNKI